jgi:endonuclease G
MLITRSLIEGSQRRMKELRFDPQKLDRELGDGPLSLSAEQKQQRYRQCLALTGTPERARAALERIIAGNDLDSINYLSKGLHAARSVCRIQLRDGSGRVIGFGSGVLIGPGVLLTNHHVFSQVSDARHSIADFDYELDARGGERESARFAFDPGRLFYANAALDFAVVAVQPRSENGGRALKDWGWLPLSAEPGKSDPGEYLTIVQHPNGERKQLCVRENKFIKYSGDAMWYLTDTMGGSSGSPVFNRFWQIVALHHSGVPRTDKNGNWLTKDGKKWDESMDESLVDWIANEGIRISAIVKHMLAKIGTHSMVRAAIDTAPPAPEAFTGGLAATRSERTGAWVEQTGDTISLVVPVRVPMELVRQEGIATSIGAAAIAAAVDAAKSPPPVMPLPIEAVNINHKTLGKRPGYKPDFLGAGKLRVPLPTIPASMKSKVATFTKDGSAFELKYFNASVVMNKARRLAFFSAVNIDGSLRQDVGKREGDTWLKDPRIKPEFQIGDEFYGKQKTFEASREQNPFDRGHLVRRLDATWGATPKEAKEHGDDTFHFTNAAPQFFSFNQGKKLWLGLEDFVLDQLETNRRKACVINGPVFDGPQAPRGGLPDASDPSRPDPTFGSVAIPKYFWKLMVVARNGKLSATAFLMSQQDQILDIDRIHESSILEKLSETDAKVFQISLRDLAKFTKLGFGDLAKVDTKEFAGMKPRLLDSLDDIRL